MERPQRGRLATHWDLDEDTVFLNHGSFGACPRFIREEQRRWQDLMERDPVRFFERTAPAASRASREALADFLRCDAADLVFVQNATSGVNTVLRSLRFEEGDELLVPDHAYQACRNALDFVAQRWGATTIVCEIPFPIETQRQALDAVLENISSRTRLALIDVVTSPTGLVMPYQALVQELEAGGVEVLLDAAHAPGMLPLDLDSLGASYTTGNCHKWLCAPKGAAFLHVRKDLQHAIHPLSLSHGMTFPLGDSTRYRLEFDWAGTLDPSAWFCIPKLISGMADLVEGGWGEIVRHNHELVLAGRELLCEVLDITALCPAQMVGSIAAVMLPGEPSAGMPMHEPDPLHDHLLDQHGIQVPVWSWLSPRGRYLRISAQLYNHIDEYAYLADCIGHWLENV